MKTPFFRQLKTSADRWIDRLQLKTQEKIFIIFLVSALLIGHVILFIKVHYNPLLLENIRVVRSDEVAPNHPTAAEILKEIDQKLAAKENLPEAAPAEAASAPASGLLVNINTAGSSELQRLPGIGPQMASRIIDYRIDNDGFKRPADLMLVKGIGPKTYAKLQPLICIENE